MAGTLVTSVLLKFAPSVALNAPKLVSGKV